MRFVLEYQIDDTHGSCYALSEEALAIRRVFAPVDMITNTRFSNCTLVFKIGAVRQQNIRSKH